MSILGTGNLNADKPSFELEPVFIHSRQVYPFDLQVVVPGAAPARAVHECLKENLDSFADILLNVGLLLPGPNFSESGRPILSFS